MSQNRATSSLSSDLLKAASSSSVWYAFFYVSRWSYVIITLVSYYSEERIQFRVETKPLLQKQVIPKEPGLQICSSFPLDFKLYL